MSHCPKGKILCISTCRALKNYTMMFFLIEYMRFSTNLFHALYSTGLYEVKTYVQGVHMDLMHSSPISIIQLSNDCDKSCIQRINSINYKSTLFLYNLTITIYLYLIYKRVIECVSKFMLISGQ